VYELYTNTDIDDSGGQTQELTKACIEIWEEIVSNAENRELLEYILEKLTETCKKIGYGEYMADEIDSFISNHFNDEGFTLSKLEIIDARIELFARDTSWHGNYELSKCVNERIKLMEDLKLSKDDMETFQRKYWHLSSIREIAMSELEDAGKLSELIKLLEESIETDKESPGLVSKYSRKLIDCYWKDGWCGKARDELFTYVTKYTRGNIDAFYELKNNTHSELWSRKREDVFNALSSQRVDYKHLLAAEGLKERLFALLSVNSRGTNGLEKQCLNEMMKYENALGPEYENELIEIYEKLIWKLSEFAGGRPHYQEIVGYMRRLFSYPEGKARVEKILESWRFTYSNRPAMQEELRALYR
jgi:hypothetical protein